MCDQDKIFPYNINAISSRQEMRMKKNIRGLLVDPIPNSQNQLYKSNMADSDENYYWYLGS